MYTLNLSADELKFILYCLGEYAKHGDSKYGDSRFTTAKELFDKVIGASITKE